MAGFNQSSAKGNCLNRVKGGRWYGAAGASFEARVQPAAVQVAGNACVNREGRRAAADSSAVAACAEEACSDPRGLMRVMLYYR